MSMRKTKIICTLGPACSSEEKILEMLDAGMDVSRLNFSHGDHKVSPDAEINNPLESRRDGRNP